MSTDQNIVQDSNAIFDNVRKIDEIERISERSASAIYKKEKGILKFALKYTKSNRMLDIGSCTGTSAGTSLSMGL